MVKELIRNGSFERGNLDFWKVEHGTVIVVSSEKKRGNYSARMQADSSTYVVLTNKDYITVNPYGLYKVSGWLKNTSLSEIDLGIAFYDSDYCYISGEDTTAWYKLGSFGWTLGEGIICIPSQASYLRMVVWGEGTNGSYGYADCLSLQEIDLNRVAVYTKELLKKENFASTGTFYSDEYFSGIWKYGEFYLNVSSLSGSSPTLDVTIQAYDPSTQIWKDIVVFDQATGAGSQLKVATAGLGWKLRVKYVTGGTITDCDFVVGAVFKR